MDTTIPAEVIERLRSRKQKHEAFVMLKYLTSYKHMGIVVVTCMRPCRCAPTRVDAHVPRGHHSVMGNTRHIPVSHASHAHECTLRFEVNKHTSSGEHKFKLVFVASGYDVVS